MIIGGGVVGMNAAFIAIGMEAEVFVFDKSIDRLRELDIALSADACSTVYSSTLAIEEMLPRADLVIGAVLVHGARAPRVVSREQLELMKRGAVLVDVSIDQGGCFETSRPTTHSDPTYEVDGVLHYCVANMPGAVPITSTYALTNATLPYVLALADHGVAGAVARDPGLRLGVNVAGGQRHPRRRRAEPRHAADSARRGARRRSGRDCLTPRPHSRGETMATAAQTTEIENFIDGEHRPGRGRRQRADPEPGDRRADRDRAAVRRGRTSTPRCRPPSAPSTEWSETPPGERALALLRIADALEEHGDELSQLESLNVGKPIEAMRTRRCRSSSTTCASSPARRAASTASRPASTCAATRR